MIFFEENFPGLKKADPTRPYPRSQNVTQPDLGKNFWAQTQVGVDRGALDRWVNLPLITILCSIDVNGQ